VGGRVLGELTACRLCGFQPLAPVGQDRRRAFYLCGGCGLVSVPERYWLSVDGERARYGLHDNSVSNGGYVRFLSEVVDAVMEAARSREFSGRPLKVLDFGSGKEAVLCRLLAENGVDCVAYDPLYGMLLPDVSLGDNSVVDIDNSCRFDIIILCEVIEHLRDIAGELRLIGNLLRDDGIVILRTQTCENHTAFPGWWYAQDPTHINFFNRQSLQKAAAIVGRGLGFTDCGDIFILK